MFGIVWIDAPIDFFVEKYKEIETFEAGSGVLQIKKLSEPPRLEDFESLTIPDEDFEALPKCKVGDCDVKASEANLERLQREVDWDAPDARERATRVVHDMVLSYIEAYRRGGNAELAVYRDKKRPNFIAEEFAGLLENSPYLPIYFPEFHEYLLNYPQAELPHSEDFFYWAKNDFGLKPIVRLNHVTIYRPPSDPYAGVAIASKQLYCSHYFHTALELRYLARDSARPDAKGFYFMNLNRSRSDGLTGFTGLVLGRTIKNRTREGQQSFLERTKRKVESAYRGARVGER